MRGISTNSITQANGSVDSWLFEDVAIEEYETLYISFHTTTFKDSASWGNFSRIGVRTQAATSAAGEGWVSVVSPANPPVLSTNFEPSLSLATRKIIGVSLDGIQVALHGDLQEHILAHRAPPELFEVIIDGYFGNALETLPEGYKVAKGPIMILAHGENSTTISIEPFLSMYPIGGSSSIGVLTGNETSIRVNSTEAGGRYLFYIEAI